TVTLEGEPFSSPTPLTDTSTPHPETGSVVEAPNAISDLAPPPEALPILQADRVGIQIHPFVTNEEWANALGLTSQIGMGWIKFQVPWDVAEPSPGNYSFQYERLVLLVQQAHIQCFKVLIGVTRAPQWARPADSDPAMHGPPADPQTFANFINKLVSDIKPEFMEAIEIWNEPNLDREWQGIPMTGQEYMRYFAPAYEAAKAIDPDAVVVTAGLAPVGEVPGTRDDRVFLQEMYAAGLANYSDVRIGVHPYAWANAPDAHCCSEGGWADSPKFFMLDTLDEYRQIMIASGDSDGLMWITEFGWGSYEGISVDGSNATPPESAVFFDRISQVQQAEWTVRALEILQAPPYEEFVEKTFLWNMNFATIENAI
ncbi:MAG TPA: hypothetical protein VJZ27_13190, partial [Aggregatilineales bacterium]|nr:hypothetical protein [Aggregatilineales bacterium]